jgi:hypothetical protein
VNPEADPAIIGAIATIAAAVIGAAGTFIVSLWKWQAALKEQTRAFAEQTRKAELESAKLAWELANYLHESDVASNALELIDGETFEVKTEQHGDHEVTDNDLRAALAADPNRPAANKKEAAIRYTFDSMFYALDRIRLAMNAKLISKDDLSSATLYYCNKLATTHGFVLDYGMHAYPTTVQFVKELCRTPEEQPRIS